MESDSLKQMAQQFGMEMVSLRNHVPEASMLAMIPADIAKRYEVIPYQKTKDGLVIAIADPMRLDVIDALSFMLKMPVEAVLSSRQEIHEALTRCYGLTMHDAAPALNFGTAAPVESAEDAVEEEAPIIKLVSMILLEAFRLGASDVHLEPLEKRFRVRYRIDGMLYEMDEPPKRLQGSIISRIKIMANMSIAEKRLPQDGRIKIKIMNRDLDLRVSTLPSQHGESVVLRILDKTSVSLGLAQLGFLPEDEKRFKDLIRLPNGILLITGPTGSGKTTTLYACLHDLNRPDRKIITVEDPIEYQLTGINQVQVNEKIGLSFAHVLRSMLRQAPNVIMVGEIRDLETANIAVNASLTGHLVFSTLHTNDAAGAITRLLDQGVKPFLVASSVRAVLAQRLVRKICQECKTPAGLDAAVAKRLGVDPKRAAAAKIYRGKGCEACHQTGYRGRIGIFELLVLDEEIQKMIYQRVGGHEIKQRAREMGMRTLREDGIEKVFAGWTTFEEVLRESHSDESR